MSKDSSKDRGSFSFTNMYGPRHTGIAELATYSETLQEQLDNVRSTAGKAPVIFASTVPPDRVPRERDLLTAYMGTDYRRLITDVATRPKHYTERQRAIVAGLRDGSTVIPAATEAERSDLVLQFVAQTKPEAAAPAPAAPKRQTKPGPEPSFEDQDFGPTIKLI